MLMRRPACLAPGIIAAHPAGKQAAKGVLSAEVQHCWGFTWLPSPLSPYLDCCLPCAGKAAMAAAAEGGPSAALPAADEAEPPPPKKGRKGKKGAKAAAAAEHRAQEEAAAKGRINLDEGERLAIMHDGYGNSCHHKRIGAFAS